jgi:hypothetical protein
MNEFFFTNAKLREKFNWQEMSINKAKLTAVTSQLLKVYDPDVIRRDLSDSHTIMVGVESKERRSNFSVFIGSGCGVTLKLSLCVIYHEGNVMP